ncbi:MAG: hypothetical protein P1Q69_00050 [Candidatus Thorarchaeota archaeon]|nr:hypothetical protein [Candidatus Thorarchaeota archaeon]
MTPLSSNHSKIHRMSLVVVLVLLSLPLSSYAVDNLESPPHTPADGSVVWIAPYSNYTGGWFCRESDVFFGNVMVVDSNYTYGNTVVVDSNDTFDFFICDSENYELWSNGEDAAFLIDIEDITSYAWALDVPFNSTWYRIYVNDGPHEIRVSSSYASTTKVKLVMIPTIYIFEIIACCAILRSFLNSVLRKRDTQSDYDSKKPLFTLEILDRIGFGALLTQSLIMLTMSIITIQYLSPIDNVTSVMGMVAVVLIIIPMALIPLACAVSIYFDRNFHYLLLPLWIPLGLVFGNLYTSFWLTARNNDSLILGLTFLVPIWMTLAYVTIRYEKKKSIVSIELQ